MCLHCTDKGEKSTGALYGICNNFFGNWMCDWMWDVYTEYDVWRGVGWGVDYVSDIANGIIYYSMYKNGFSIDY